MFAYQVCLQFPDELLGDAAAVSEALTHHLGQLVYILGDTTYGRQVKLLVININIFLELP